MIRFQNVSYRYASQENDVVKNLNVSFEKGSFTVILGKNGSGKSTLAKLANGLYKPTEGAVYVDGINTADEEQEIEIKRRVGLVFQNPDNQLVAGIVEEDVAFGPENLGIEPAEICRRVDDALKTVNMYEYRRFAPNKLSGGQKQRVAIAGILAMQPECIVLDEPTAMLDPIGRREVLSAVTRLNRDFGMTVLLITHFMEEAQNADRIMIMNDGALICEGTPGDVFARTELIHRCGLALPQTTELLAELKKAGYPVRTGIIDSQACAREIAGLFSKSH